MKRFFCVLCLGLFVAASAFASDGAKLYKSACAGCHGADGGKSTGGSTPLKGQSEADILQKLKGYGDGSYGGKEKEVMRKVVKKRSPEELEALAGVAAGL